MQIYNNTIFVWFCQYKSVNIYAHFFELFSYLFMVMFMGSGALYLFKCFICGFAMCFPGLSGGSMAVLLGIYATAAECAAGILRDFKRYFSKFLYTVLFFLLGCASFVFLLGDAARKNEKAFRIFAVCAAAVSSLYCLLRLIREYRGSGIVKPSAAFACGVLILTATRALFGSFSFGCISHGFLPLMLTGALLSVALILPGISVTYMMVFFGIYEPAVAAARQLDIGFLFPIALGAASGIVLFTGVIAKTIERHGCAAQYFLLGFTAASIFFMI